MPTFIDRHPVNAVSPDLRQRLYLEARNKQLDPCGARPVGNWIEDGTIFCIIEAPTKDVMCEHHMERGLPCDDAHEIANLQQLAPPTEQDQRMVRAAISALWPRS